MKGELEKDSKGSGCKLLIYHDNVLHDQAIDGYRAIVGW